MKLFMTPGACSLADHIALTEAGIHVDAVKVDLATRRTEHGVSQHIDTARWELILAAQSAKSCAMESSASARWVGVVRLCCVKRE